MIPKYFVIVLLAASFFGSQVVDGQGVDEQGVEDSTLTGTLVAIMEVEPLRLRIETEDAVRTVQLTADTMIVMDREPVPVNRLREGQRLTIVGRPSTQKPRWLVARKITIERR